MKKAWLVWTCFGFLVIVMVVFAAFAKAESQVTTLPDGNRKVRVYIPSEAMPQAVSQQDGSLCLSDAVDEQFDVGLQYCILDGKVQATTMQDCLVFTKGKGRRIAIPVPENLHSFDIQFVLKTRGLRVAGVGDSFVFSSVWTGKSFCRISLPKLLDLSGNEILTVSKDGRFLFPDVVHSLVEQEAGVYVYTKTGKVNDVAGLSAVDVDIEYGSSDGAIIYIENDTTTWTAIRGETPGKLCNSGFSPAWAPNMVYGWDYGGGGFALVRSFLSFDLSGIAGTVTAATVNIHGNTNNGADVVLITGSASPPYTVDNILSFTGSLGSNGLDRIAAASWNTSDYNVFTLTPATVQSALGGDFNLAVVCGEDYDNIGPPGVAKRSGGYVASNADPTLDPYIEITMAATTTTTTTTTTSTTTTTTSTTTTSTTTTTTSTTTSTTSTSTSTTTTTSTTTSTTTTLAGSSRFLPDNPHYSTIGTGKEYPTITDWMSSTVGDLSAGGEVGLLSAEVFDESVQLRNDTGLDATHFRVLMADAGAENKGSRTSGARINFTGNWTVGRAPLYVLESYAGIYDIGITGSSHSVAGTTAGILIENVDGVKISGVTVWNITNTDPVYGAVASGFTGVNMGGSAFYNNIASGCSGAGFLNFILGGSGGNTQSFLNSTSVGNGIGFAYLQYGGVDTNVAKNCISQSNGTNWFGVWTKTTCVDAGVVFVSSPTNLHLDPTDTAATGQGTNLLPTDGFNDDVDKQTRVVPWSIGADQGSGGTTTTTTSTTTSTTTTTSTLPTTTTTTTLQRIRIIF